MDSYQLSKIQSISNMKQNNNNNNIRIINSSLLTLKPIKKKVKTTVNYKKPSHLTISTFTMTSNLNDTIDLFILSRLIPIFNENHQNTIPKDGCFISISDYTEDLNTDLPRGHVDEKIKLHVFNNQISLYFKYWDFKKINVKIFTNGKLQLTGIKDPWEAEFMSNQLKDKLNKLYCIIHSDKKKLKNIQNIDFAFVWNKKLNKVEFYRRKLNIYNIRNIINNGLIYRFDSDENANNIFKWEHQNNVKILFENFKNESTKKINSLESLYNRLLSIYEFNYEQKNNIITTLNTQYSKIIKINKKKIIHNDDKFKKNIIMNINKIIKTLKNYNLKLDKCYQTDLYFTNIINVIFKKIIYNKNNLNSNTNEIDNTNEISLNFEEEISSEFLDKKYLENIKNCINNFDTSKYNIIYDNETDIKIEIKDIFKKNYYINNITTELINSDFNTNFNINLNKVSNILKNEYSIYNYYQPNNKYPGVIIKFYYNKDYLDTTKHKIGVCNCPINCAEKDKKTCTTISISVFRPGSIIITAAKNTEQLIYAYNFINKFLKDNLQDVIYENDYDNSQQFEINQTRKIYRKQQLYYINKKDIIDFPKE